jgi:ATP/maltotriose-dependent transcriptional regulator MalT
MKISEIASRTGEVFESELALARAVELAGQVENGDLLPIALIARLELADLLVARGDLERARAALAPIDSFRCQTATQAWLARLYGARAALAAAEGRRFEADRDASKAIGLMSGVTSPDESWIEWQRGLRGVD